MVVGAVMLAAGVPGAARVGAMRGTGGQGGGGNGIVPGQAGWVVVRVVCMVVG